MIHQSLLHQFDYSIPATSETYAGPLKVCGKKLASHLPLLKMKIDFLTGTMRIDADRRFIAREELHHNSGFFTSYRERVMIEAIINSSIEINLAGNICDGLLFPVEGKINDGSIICSCTGMIILEAGCNNNIIHFNTWMLNIYLYNALVENFEIKLKLPLYYASVSSHNN